jgi:hypothetical protein
VTPPRVLIVLEIEAAPRILIETETYEEKERLAYWILETRGLAELVEEAADLGAEMRRAA